MIKDEMVPFMQTEEIDDLVTTLAEQIQTDYEGKDLVVICPLRGSLHLVADLIRKLDMPVRLDFVYLSSVEKGGAIRLIKDISVNITGQHVLIVEEVIDTGRTLNFLKTRLHASAPASLRILTLLDKPSRRELPLRPDYIGRTIDDRYVVGYGMDNEELGRNYPEIYNLKN